ncbi:unnamed protein product [Acanthoscelides obtectus]|uniref:Uncharacterized protein n=1 Tax=Acanthoscelides obtectus TaxID=200917 RepID=A0A9P0KMY5_ACAOB|nr:unnamed protein product [Acanthoscelides obtectus]CAK1633089.1 hypothetical protein AOBTE_LOCUS7941 [Acanthoscelides obtectus]
MRSHKMAEYEDYIGGTLPNNQVRYRPEIKVRGKQIDPISHTREHNEVSVSFGFHIRVLEPVRDTNL